MWSVRLALRRPYTIAVVSLLILVLGILLLSRILKRIDDVGRGEPLGLSGGASRGVLAEAQARRTAAEAALDSLIDRVRQEVYTDYSDLQVAKDKIAVLSGLRRRPRKTSIWPKDAIKLVTGISSN